ncbi:leucine-rich repeat domain-containing protein [Flavobacterium sp. W22_SRS_FK3]|uniref:leucine-rich repeat domain-containing protein n=1 Tax=Flavobacterium sp. W22_SRS_FK3 TaxID=3240275 RepID=UPI003F91D516
MIKKLLLIFALVNITIASAKTIDPVETFVVDGITYEIISGTTVKVIANPSGYENDIVIPSTVTSETFGTFDVTEIGASAFANSENLLTVEVGAKVTTIGASAFSGSNYLTKISLSEGITTIGDAAFDSCYSLISLTLPSSVISLGATVFNQCFSLTQIICNISSPLPIDPENGFGAFDSSSCRLIVPTASLNSYKAAAVWQDFDPITDVAPFILDDIAYEITSDIDAGAVKHSGNWVGTVKVIVNTENRYSGSITIPATIQYNEKGYNVTEIDPRAFKYNQDITSVVIGDNVAAIDEYTFEECSELSMVKMGSSVASIGNDAFSYCESLTTINIPASVTSIGDEAFQYCTRLATIDVPNSVTSIGEYAFNRSGVTSFKFPSGITTVEFAVFASCKELASVTIPSTVTNIKDFAFNFCPKLKSLTCAVESPLDISGLNVFSGNTDISSCTLVVPTASVEEYKAAAVWQDFYSITGSNTLGTIDFEAKNDVSLYPNPVDSELFMQLNTADKATIQLIDTTGKVLIQKTVTASENSIDTSNLATGLYFVKVKSSEGIITKKVIKK